jgi:hypothetical protein
MKVGDFVYQTHSKFYGIVLEIFSAHTNTVRLKVLKDSMNRYPVGYESIWVNNTRPVTQEEKSIIL